MATIRDVAAKAGVSKSTVSLAFSSPERVSRETLGKIRRASASVGYAADPLAQTLASGRSRIIGMIVADISVPFFSNVLREVERSAAAAGYFVVISDSGGDPNRELDLLNHYAGMRVAGVALSPCGFGDDYAARLGQIQIPTVCFDNQIPGLATAFVGSNNRLASSMLTAHLLQLGHRRIAFVSGSEHAYTAAERLAGYEQAMTSADVPLDKTLIVPGKYIREAAYAESMRLLTRADRPTAIIAANSVMGLATLQAMQELGFACPQQISLAMIDDTEWSAVITPKLTMVVQDTVELGRKLASRLLSAILHPETQQPYAQEDLVDVKFVPGQSCGRPE